MFIRLFLLATLIPLQACSNTLIGEKLENSFDIPGNQIISENISKATVKNKPEEGKETKLIKKDYKIEKENKPQNSVKNNLISNKNRLIQKSSQPIKNLNFKPQPYRIILKLSGANPSAPAETVTEALRKAGVEFEVEKIERFDEKSFIKNSLLTR